MILQGAQVTNFGIGENMITSKSDPVFGGVYKLAAVKDGGRYLDVYKRQYPMCLEMPVTTSPST